MSNELVRLPVKRNGWEDGPWNQEPDFERWIYVGYYCKAIRVQDLGHWCGYVRIPGGHPLHGVSYSDDVITKLIERREEVKNESIGKRGPMDILLVAAGGAISNGMLFDVHGGITYSATEEDGTFWYGFDCSHCDDFAPGMHATMKQIYAASGKNMHPPTGIYRTLGYVKLECESLVRQLQALE